MCPSINVLFDSLTVYEHLSIKAKFKGLKGGEIANIMKSLNLEQYKNFKISKLSGGNKRKLMLAMAILGTDDLLIMDEPTSSIDPESRVNIWDLIKDLK